MIIPLLVTTAAAGLATARPSSSSSCLTQYTSRGHARTYKQRVFWLDGTPAKVWDMDARSHVDAESSESSGRAMVRTNRIFFPVYENGDAAGKPIVGVLPCSDDYSDAWMKVEVIVDDKTAFDSITDISAITDEMMETARMWGVHNFPIVTMGSSLNGDQSSASFAWYSGQKVTYFDFNGDAVFPESCMNEEQACSVDASLVAVVPIKYKKDYDILQTGAIGSAASFYMPVAVDGAKVSPGAEMTSFSAIKSAIIKQPVSTKRFIFNYPLVDPSGAKRKRDIDKLINFAYTRKPVPKKPVKTPLPPVQVKPPPLPVPPPTLKVVPSITFNPITGPAAKTTVPTITSKPSVSGVQTAQSVQPTTSTLAPQTPLNPLCNNITDYGTVCTGKNTFNICLGGSFDLQFDITCSGSQICCPTYNFCQNDRDCPANTSLFAEFHQPTPTTNGGTATVPPTSLPTFAGPPPRDVSPPLNPLAAGKSGPVYLTVSGVIQTIYPTATPVPVVLPPYLTWNPIGCLSLLGKPLSILRANFPAVWTVEECALLCGKATGSYGVFGLYINVCLCDYYLQNKTSIDLLPGDCNVPCFGNSSETCGSNRGGAAMNAFQLDPPSYSPPTKSNAVSSSSTFPPFQYNYTYLGCYLNPTEVTPALQIQSLVNSVEECADLCAYAFQASGYFGLTKNRCYCYNSPLTLKTSDVKCNVKCPGNADERCGGLVIGASYASLYLLTYFTPPTYYFSYSSIGCVSIYNNWQNLIAWDGASVPQPAINPFSVFQYQIPALHNLEDCAIACAAQTNGTGYFGMVLNTCLCDFSLQNTTAVDEPKNCKNTFAVSCLGNPSENCGSIGDGLNTVANAFVFNPVSTNPPAGSIPFLPGSTISSPPFSPYGGSISYVGCYPTSAVTANRGTPQFMPLNSVEACGDLCAYQLQSSPVYFSLTADTTAGLTPLPGYWCWCQQSAPPRTSAVSETSCSATCPGDPSEICGGPSSESFYVMNAPTTTYNAPKRTTTNASGFGGSTTAIGPITTSTVFYFPPVQSGGATTTTLAAGGSNQLLFANDYLREADLERVVVEYRRRQQQQRAEPVVGKLQLQQQEQEQQQHPMAPAPAIVGSPEQKVDGSGEFVPFKFNNLAPADGGNAA